MNWLQANKKLARLGCNEAVATVLVETKGIPPPNNAPASLVCQRKVREHWLRYECNDRCPKKEAAQL